MARTETRSIKWVCDICSRLEIVRYGAKTKHAWQEKTYYIQEGEDQGPEISYGKTIAVCGGTCLKKVTDRLKVALDSIDAKDQ